MRRLPVLRSPCALRRRHVAPLPPRLPHRGAMPTPIQTRQIQWKKADPVKRLNPWEAALHYGQPVHETHPHILDSGHLTPGIPATEYHHRRNQLILDIPDGAVAVLPSADIKYASGAVFYPFRQESNFWYLTGWEEPESVAVIERRGRDYLFTLFCREKNSESEQWGGPWSGCQAAQDVFNADAAYPITAVDSRLQQILKTATYIYTDVDASNSSPHKLAATLRGASCPIHPLSPILNQHRAVKSQAERAVMRKAAEISSEGFNTAMSIQWSTESDIANILSLQFCQRGGSGHAYVPVVAAGHRGLFIHWTQNNRLIFPEDLITVDAGASFGGYSADITRTWPNSGKFTPAQKDLYQVVLSVQRAAVSSCHEDSGLNLDALHLKVQDELREGLKDLGFDVSCYDAMRILFPHHVGHHVGIDVHDMPGYPKNAPFKHGNCITVEPGIYVPNDERWPVHFRGMGIRVEDYVCVGRGAGTVYNFSSNAVKEVDDIEHLPRKQLGHPLLYVTEPKAEDALSSTKPAEP